MSLAIRMLLLLVLVAGSLLGGVGMSPAHAANEPLDAPNPQDGLGFDENNRSLRMAVQEANRRPGDDVIVLEKDGLYELGCKSGGTEDDNESGDLDYHGPERLHIKGNGATIRQTCPGEAVIHGPKGGSLFITDATVENGGAGGIEMQGGLVALDRATVRFNSGSAFGGVRADTVHAVFSEVWGNKGAIGGIASQKAVVWYSSVWLNTGTAVGGLGGVYSVDAFNSTVAYNRTVLAAGAENINPHGGILSVDHLNLRNTTVYNNTETKGTTEIGYGGTLTAHASAIGNDTGQPACKPGPAAFGRSLGHNAVADASCGIGGVVGDINPVGDLGFDRLDFNGGLTRNLLPAADSPLVDRGGDSCEQDAFNADQRGIARPRGKACDIGAVER